MASLWKCVGTRGSLVHEGTLMGQDVPGTAIPYGMCCCTASTCAYTGCEPLRDDGGRVANTECSGLLELQQGVCVSTRVVGSLKLGTSNAKVGYVVHTFLVCYTYIMVYVCRLAEVDAELHGSRESHFGWLC
jgi:hypothetical protein